LNTPRSASVAAVRISDIGNVATTGAGVREGLLDDASSIARRRASRSIRSASISAAGAGGCERASSAIASALTRARSRI